MYMKKNVLRVNEPIITSFPRYANLISITCNDEDKLTWFYENMIPIQINCDKTSIDLDFHVGYNVLNLIKFCPVIHPTVYQRKLIDKAYEDIVDFFIEQVDEGKCLYYLTHTFEISEYGDYLNTSHSRNHDIMIYGYDKQTQVFLCSDFFTGPYTHKEISFDSIRIGYYNIEMTDDFDWLWGVIALESPQNAIYDLDIHNVVQYLIDYINGFDPVKHNKIIDFAFDKDKHRFGIDVYAEIQKYLKYILDNDFTADKRGFHTLYDHKQILLGLVNYLSKYGYLNNSSIHIINVTELRDRALIIRNYILKYNVTMDKKVLKFVIRRLEELKVFELAVIQNIINDIGSVFVKEELEDKSGFADFVGVDDTTKGNWIGVYGNTGYQMSCNSRSISNPSNLNILYKYKYINDIHTNDCRALKTTDGLDRISSSYVGSVGESIKINFYAGDQSTNRIAIYFLDWWKNSGVFVRAYSGSEDVLLDEHHILDTNSGVYALYQVRGNVTFEIIADEEENIPFFSGIFIN